MISLNVSSDLDAALRSLAQQSNRSLSAVCCGLLRLGMERSPADVLAAINAAARPIGRPMTLPTSEAEAKPKETVQEVMKRKRREIDARKAAERGKK